eukprot:g40676.t1
MKIKDGKKISIGSLETSDGCGELGCSDGLSSKWTQCTLKWAQRGLAADALGSQWHLRPSQIHEGGSGGEFGPSTGPGGIGSSCIGEVGPKRTHDSGRAKFRLVASMLVRSSEDWRGHRW